MIKEQVKEILKKVKRLQNGDISTAMANMGIKYKLNYGVSIPQLQQLAKDYSKDNDLAFLLFNKDIREAKVISSMLFDTELLLSVELINISEGIDNIELIEQFSRNIFSKSSKLVKILPVLIDGNYWQEALAVYSISWGIKNNLNIQEYLVNFGIDKLKSINSIENSIVKKAFVFMLQTISNINEKYYSSMIELAKETDNKSINTDKDDIFKEFLFIYSK